MLKKTALSLLITAASLSADMTLAPSRLEVKDGYNMYLEGQFLWWLSKTENLYFCQDGAQNQSGYTGFNGTLKQFNTQFTPGLKFTFGGLMAYDHWDIHFTYTYFTQSSTANTGENSLYLGNTFGLSSLTNQIKAKYSLSLNMFDAVMTRPSWMGERFGFAPFFGARGTWLDQNFKTKVALTSTTPYDKLGKNRSQSDFNGAGLIAGFGLRYELKGGWCFEGNFLGSGIYGKFVNYFNGYLKDNNGRPFSSQDQTLFSRQVKQSMLTSLEYKLGIAYNKFIKQGRYHLGGGLAWEEVIFLNGNQLPLWSTALNTGSSNQGLALSNPSNLLTLQGISFRFVFGF